MPEKPSEYANPYDKHWDYRKGMLDIGPRFHMRTRHMLRFFPPSPKRILDIGCGDGYFLQLLASKGYRADGLDGSEKAIQLCRERMGEAMGEFTCCFIEEFHPPEPYDLLTCGEVLEHIEDDRAFLREMNRIAAPDATLVLTVPFDVSLWSKADEDAGHFRHYTKSDLFEKIREAGFEPERHVVWGYPLTRYLIARIRRAQTRMIEQSRSKPNSPGAESKKKGLSRYKTFLRPLKYVFLFDNLFNWTGKGVDIVVRARKTKETAPGKRPGNNGATQS